VAIRSVEVVADVEPIAALAEFVAIATPALAVHGFELEDRGRDWAHWTRGFPNVIRAYAFRHEGDEGVSMCGQGELPAGVLDEVADKVVSVTGWRRRESQGEA
jgi:hypothetical protein